MCGIESSCSFLTWWPICSCLLNSTPSNVGFVLGFCLSPHYHSSNQFLWRQQPSLWRWHLTEYTHITCPSFFLPACSLPPSPPPLEPGLLFVIWNLTDQKRFMIFSSKRLRRDVCLLKNFLSIQWIWVLVTFFFFISWEWYDFPLSNLSMKFITLLSTFSVRLEFRDILWLVMIIESIWVMTNADPP